MADGLDDDDDEEQFLRDNADLLPFCSIDVACIAAEYGRPGIGVYPVTMEPVWVKKIWLLFYFNRKSLSHKCRESQR